jgi:hypothetical protein
MVYMSGHTHLAIFLDSKVYQVLQVSAGRLFDVDDPRTWKSICLSCNKSRNLSCHISCCY